MLGYHGCERDIGETILAGGLFKDSENDYDWLGHGIYFWEANPRRALDFAKETFRRKNPGVLDNAPFVVGAVIDLGNCLDMMSMTGVEEVKVAFNALKAQRDSSANLDPLPRQIAGSSVRKLDCAVINHLHFLRNQAGMLFPVYDTVRGLFVEGDAIYPGSGFHEKTHIQICVRSRICIKGVFRVPENHYM